MSFNHPLVPGISQHSRVAPDGSRTTEKHQRFGRHLVTSYSKESPEKLKLLTKGTPGTVTSYGTSCRPPRTHSGQPSSLPRRTPISSPTHGRALLSSPTHGRSKNSGSVPPRFSTSGHSEGPRMASQSRNETRQPAATVQSRTAQNFGGHRKVNVTQKTVFVPAPPVLPPSAVGHPGEPGHYPGWLIQTAEGLKPATHSTLLMNSREEDLQRGRQSSNGTQLNGISSPKVNRDTSHGAVVLFRKKSSSSW